MSTVINLVTHPFTPKSLPRDPSRVLAALMSLRFAVNYDWDNFYSQDFITNDNNWLNVVGEFIDWPLDLMKAFTHQQVSDLTIEDEASESALPVSGVKFGDGVFKCFVAAYRKHPNQFHTLFQQAIAPLEQHWQQIRVSDSRAQNIAMLGSVLGLNATESAILLLLVYRDSKSFNAFSYLDYADYSKAIQVLACMLSETVEAISEALSPKAVLAKTGIVARDFIYPSWNDFIELREHVKTVICLPNNNVRNLMRHFVEEASPSQLTLSDIPHLQATLAMLVPVLQNAVLNKESGINILIYGQPGTGKTEFAKLLAACVGYSLYQVSSSDHLGEPMNGRERFISMGIAQTFLANNQDSLVLFDEIEEALAGNDGSSYYSHKRKKHIDGCFNKVWINQCLETNRIPTIWICNDHNLIDPAFLRRFVFHFEIGIPPRSVRQKIAERYLAGLNVSHSVLKKLSEHEALSPAQLESAARLVKLNGSQDSAEIGGLLDNALKNSMAAMGQAFVSLKHCVTPYSLDYLNIDTPMPMSRIVTALQKSTKASLCFYGHPGTGKTQLAHFLSDALDKPLLIKRASDLLSPYVGENEVNIAKMFKEASHEKAILFLDEADSFLSDRQTMSKGWEVSKVNELLQQMEQFQGIFICATNLFDQLDKAALRRFVFKIRFDYLNVGQRQNLFADSLNVKVDALLAEHQRRLQKLDALTPGDFATVLQQAHIFNETINAEQLIEQLEKESALKNGEKMHRSIGFI